MLKSYIYKLHNLDDYNARMTREDDPAYGEFDLFTDQICNEIYPDMKDRDVWFRSVYSYTKLIESLSHYSVSHSVSEGLKRLSWGGRLAKRYFALQGEKKLHPISLDDPDFFTKAQIRMDKSAGMSMIGFHKDKATVVSMRYAREILDGKTPHPAIAYARTQKKGKTRLVWGYPFEMTILEAVIARPIINYYLATAGHNPMSFGMTSVVKGSMFQNRADQSKYAVSIDQSQFDAHVQSWDIEMAFDVLKTFFDLDEPVDKLGHTVRDIFKVVESYFIHTPIVVPCKGRKYPSLVLGKDRGVPSGSYFTQIVDSIVNFALTSECLKNLDVKWNKRSMFVLGDDNVTWTVSKVDLTALQSQAARYGYKVHGEEKSHIYDVSEGKFEFAGIEWVNYMPWRTQRDVVERAIAPESRREYDGNRAQKLSQASLVVHSYGLTSLIHGRYDYDFYYSTPQLKPTLSHGIEYLRTIIGDRFNATRGLLY